MVLQMSEVFHCLNEPLISIQILQNFNPEPPIVVETDDSNYVLSKIQSQSGSDASSQLHSFERSTFLHHAPTKSITKNF